MPSRAAKPKSVFVSYRHLEEDWVWGRLVPCLKAGGAQLLIDREQFEAGKKIKQQMDDVQDRADVNVLVVSKEYAQSEYCRHEMSRAIELDQDPDKGTVIPVVRDHCELPDSLRQRDCLNVDLSDDRKALPSRLTADLEDPWDLLLEACGASLGVSAPQWLQARDEAKRLLGRADSVNLVVSRKVAWKGLIEDLLEDDSTALEKVVDLQKPRTASRRGLVEEILQCCGHGAAVPPEPEDLGVLDRVLSQFGKTHLVMTHFDLVAHRESYGVDLFAALRYLLMESKSLVLLAQSRTPFAALLPRDNPLSTIDMKTIELQGRI